MKLYHIPASRSLAAHIVIRELGLDATLVKVDYKRHVTDEGASFYDVNAHGYVPALALDDGRVLREGPAIMQYLADLHPEAQLAPPNGSFERYRLQEWLNFLSTEVHKGFIPLLYAAQAGKYVEVTRPKLEQRYA